MQVLLAAHVPTVTKPVLLASNAEAAAREIAHTCPIPEIKGNANALLKSLGLETA